MWSEKGVSPRNLVRLSQCMRYQPNNRRHQNVFMGPFACECEVSIINIIGINEYISKYIVCMCSDT